MDKLVKIGGKPVLYEDSDPVVNDEDGEWTFDAQTAVETASGELRTQTVLERPLGANPLLSASMFSPEGLCSEALMDHDGKCVSMQLTKLLKASVAQIEKEIGSERVPAEAIAKVAMARGMPLYIPHSGRTIKEYRPRPTTRRVVWPSQWRVITLISTSPRVLSVRSPTWRWKTTAQ